MKWNKNTNLDLLHGEIIQFGDRKIYRFRDDVIEFLTKGELNNGQ